LGDWQQLNVGLLGIQGGESQSTIRRAKIDPDNKLRRHKAVSSVKVN
jgi:hypothetical protein